MSTDRNAHACRITAEMRAVLWMEKGYAFGRLSAVACCLVAALVVSAPLARGLWPDSMLEMRSFFAGIAVHVRSSSGLWQMISSFLLFVCGLTVFAVFVAVCARLGRQMGRLAANLVNAWERNRRVD